MFFIHFHDLELAVPEPVFSYIFMFGLTAPQGPLGKKSGFFEALHSKHTDFFRGILSTLRPRRARSEKNWVCLFSALSPKTWENAVFRVFHDSGLPVFFMVLFHVSMENIFSRPSCCTVNYRLVEGASTLFERSRQPDFPEMNAPPPPWS